jgi:hypothetical protein
MKKEKKDKDTKTQLKKKDFVVFLCHKNQRAGRCTRPGEDWRGLAGPVTHWLAPCCDAQAGCVLTSTKKKERLCCAFFFQKNPTKNKKKDAETRDFDRIT